MHVIQVLYQLNYTPVLWQFQFSKQLDKKSNKQGKNNMQNLSTTLPQTAAEGEVFKLKKGGWFVVSLTTMIAN